jgi:MbtH protein
MNAEDDSITYRVVANGEDQYSIWPLETDLPAGWRDTGFSGTKERCLDHIEQV